MQNVIIPFNGTNLDLSQIPDITEDIVNWHLQINATPPTPPNLFSVIISYFDNNEIKIIKSSVINMQNLQTNITNIIDQKVRTTFLLFYCNPPKAVSDDIEVAIKRPTHGNEG